jgi:hypothetical protein
MTLVKTNQSWRQNVGGKCLKQHAGRIAATARRGTKAANGYAIMAA